LSIAAFSCTGNENQYNGVANTTISACSRSGASSLKSSGTEQAIPLLKQVLQYVPILDLMCDWGETNWPKANLNFQME